MIITEWYNDKNKSLKMKLEARSSGWNILFKAAFSDVIPCRDCDAVYIGETGRSLKTRKREHFDAVKRMNVKKFALCQHIADFNHFIAWDKAKILKMEAN